MSEKQPTTPKKRGPKTTGNPTRRRVITLRLYESQYRQLKRLAANRGIGVSTLVRETIDEAIEVLRG